LSSSWYHTTMFTAHCDSIERKYLLVACSSGS
jgi:hypothetical protein